VLARQRRSFRECHCLREYVIGAWTALVRNAGGAKMTYMCVKQIQIRDGQDRRPPLVTSPGSLPKKYT
jgi:hypothetical protein